AQSRAVCARGGLSCPLRHHAEEYSVPTEYSSLTALVDQQRLDATADRVALVEESRVRDADPVRLRERDRVQADPVPLRHAVQMHAQVDVDEEVAGPVEGGADAVACIGGDQHPL